MMMATTVVAAQSERAHEYFRFSRSIALVKVIRPLM
jgi:hypothetical protein